MLEIFLDSALITGTLLMLLFSVLIIKAIISLFTPDNRTEEQKKQDAEKFIRELRRSEK